MLWCAVWAVFAIHNIVVGHKPLWLHVGALIIQLAGFSIGVAIVRSK